MKRISIKVISRMHMLKDTNDQGGVAAEYGVLLAGIVGVVAVAAATLGSRIGGLFDSILP
jgi:Flp pilus assembly pilin Flp